MIGRGGEGGRGPRSHRRSRLRLALLVFTGLVLLTLDFRSDGGGPLSSARGVVLDVLGPVRSFSGWVLSPVSNAWHGMTNYSELEDENDRLRAEIASQQSDVLQVGEIERERQELFRLLDARNTVADIPRVTARVIDAPVSNFERTIELDKGSRDGVVVGMPVETGAGLIGRVSDVSSTRSLVELITDPNFAVGVRVVRSGDDGLAEGRGRGEDLKVSLIELETVVIPGETVVTSGFQGSSFPEGLLVGTVVDVVPNAVQDTQLITVHPSAELDRLRWVSVILHRPDAPAPVVVDREPEAPPAEGDTVPSTTTPSTTTPPQEDEESGAPLPDVTVVAGAAMIVGVRGPTGESS